MSSANVSVLETADDGDYSSCKFSSCNATQPQCAEISALRPKKYSPTHPREPPRSHNATMMARATALSPLCAGGTMVMVFRNLKDARAAASVQAAT